ncbi:hypothetical protein D3C71_1324890 [compost metagenome]
MAPDSVSVPVPCLVMKPPPLIAPLSVPLNAPVSMTGSLLPVSLIVLAIVSPFALKPSVVSSSIDSVPVPSAWLWPTFRRPWRKAVPPVCVFSPDNVSAPVPTLTSEPPTPEITPEISVSVLRAPVVSALAPSSTRPAPSNAPMLVPAAASRAMRTVPPALFTTRA